jgi:hypothetical protein
VNDLIGVPGSEGATGTSKIRLLDPQAAMTASQEEIERPTAIVERVDIGAWTILDEDAEGLLLMAQGLYDLGSNSFSSSALVRLNAGEAGPEIYRDLGNIGNSAGIDFARTLTDLVVWLVLDFEGNLNNQPVQTVYASARPGSNQAWSEDAKPRRVYTARGINGLIEEPDLVKTFHRINFGDRLVAYALDGHLHVHDYVEDLDLVMESGVSTIWTSKPNDPLFYEERLR